MLRHYILALLTITLLIALWAQPTKNTNQLPADISLKLDSLKKTDNLTEWLYTYRAYVTEDPVKRIPILSKAQSSAWRECRSDAERIEYFNCLACQGYYLMYAGNILASINAYESAYRFYFEKPLPDENIFEYVLKPLGNNYTRLGDYDRALFIHSKALTLAGNKDDSASIYSNLAIVQRSRDDLDAAATAADQGLKLLAQNTSLKGLLLSTRADISLRQGVPEKAADYISEAISILTKHQADDKNNVPYWLMSAYRVRGDLYSSLQNFAEANSAYQKALDIIELKFKGERKREKAQVLISMAQVRFRQNDIETSSENFDDALSALLPAHHKDEIPAINNLYGEYTLLDALQGKADCLAAMNKKEDALKYYMLFFSAQKKLRGEFVSEDSKQKQQADYRMVTESAIETAYGLLKSTGLDEYAGKVLLIAEMSKSQLLLDEMTRNLRISNSNTGDTLLEKQKQLMQAIAYYEREQALIGDSSLTKIGDEIRSLQYELAFVQKKLQSKYTSLTEEMINQEVVSTDSLLKNIPAATRIVEFFAGKRAIYTIEASSGKVGAITKLNNGEKITTDISEFVTTWFQHGPQKMINDPGGYCRSSYNIYYSLLKQIKPAEHLLVIPDGVIGSLPMDALITDSVYREDIDQWPFLIRRSDLYYSYSLQTWQQQHQTKTKNTLFTGYFISFDSSENTSLPAVKKEYEAVHNIIKGEYFRDEEVSLKKFTDRMDEVNLLHVSTHSFLQGKENLPVLQLADNKFFIFDLYGRSFHPQLVVLSACRTGQGMLAEGEGIISLARGFTGAGAGGIVAGLWNMNDESTAGLMGTFYEQLADIHSPAGALHLAKLQWLKNSANPKIQKLPYFWAGLIYSGGDTPINVSQKTSNYFLWLIVAGFILIIILLSARKAKTDHRLSGSYIF